MASWNLVMYFYHRTHSFFVTPNTHYTDLIQVISHHFRLILDNYLLEIYDSRFKRYIILDEEYIINLQDRLPRTSVSTLNGRLIKRQVSIKSTTRHYISIDHKRKRTSSSFSPQNDHLIIWLDSYIGHPENCRHLKHKFHITTMLDIARPMVDYELCIDDLIQTNSQSRNNKNYFNTFCNKDECLDFLKQVESTMKILFITSNFFGEEIVPLIVQRVHMIYILVYDRLFFYEWAFDYKSSLLIFNDDIDLLVRLIRDLAHDFVEKAEMAAAKSSLQQTVILLRWAKKLFNRANELDGPSFLYNVNLIDRQLETLEMKCMSTELDEDDDNNNEKNDKFALECDEG